MKRTLILAAVATAVAGQVQARDYISIVGSSTVYPFATVVAEQFGKTTDFKTPKIESTGSGGGLKLFCAGVEPTFENIAAQDYPVSRPLYFYVKKAHIGTIPGMVEYLTEFASDRAWGPDGYLADKGMIPMPDEERMKFADDVKNLSRLNLASN